MKSLSARTAIPPLVLSLGLIVGCNASQRSYPSLQPRPIEAVAALPPTAASQPRVADAALDDRAATLETQAVAADAAFAKDAAAAQSAVTRSAASGSDAWLDAQQALSTLEAGRGTLSALLEDVDALRFEAFQKTPPPDTARIEAAYARIAAMDAAQAATIAALATRLR